MKKRLRISLVLMVISMALLAAFQGWWLYKSYEEEKETLTIRTSVLFREALFDLQASTLKMDTNLRVRVGSSPANAVGVVNSMRSMWRDSLSGRNIKSTMVVSMDQRSLYRSDSTVPLPGATKTFVQYGPNQIFDVLLGSESAKDTLKIADIRATFDKALKAQDLEVPYKVVKRIDNTMQIGNVRHIEQLRTTPRAAAQQGVTLGFMYPVTYKLELGNIFPYLLTQISSQLMFALFLLAMTVVSFLTLYRSLLAQKKLAGIKNDFISNITHELKTPIATVSVAIEALKNFNALHDPHKTKEYLDISQNELQRLSLLVDKVLKLSMFENKAIELKPEPLDLRTIVDEVSTSMRLQLEKYKAQLSIETNGDTSLRGDRLHLTSVIFNLLDNALKYSKAYPSIRIEINGTAEHVELTMIDNGIGIAPEYRQRIFEKFFRVPSGDTHNAKGYGLGLSYVAHVVQKHNGTIEVDSQPGIGSRFTLKLPKI